jgi:hypothetical protein
MYVHFLLRCTSYYPVPKSNIDCPVTAVRDDLMSRVIE